MTAILQYLEFVEGNLKRIYDAKMKNARFDDWMAGVAILPNPRAGFSGWETVYFSRAESCYASPATALQVRSHPHERRGYGGVVCQK